MKNKGYMIISVDTEKSFNKIQHHFMLKTPSRIGIEGIFYYKSKQFMKNSMSVSF